VLLIIDIRTDISLYFNGDQGYINSWVQTI
jgi:hypothetical protein